VFAAALYVAVWLRFPDVGFRGFEAQYGSLSLRAALFAVATCLSYLALGLYTVRQRANAAGMGVRIVLGLMASFGVVAVLFYAVPSLGIGRGVLAIAISIAFLATLLTRAVSARAVDAQAFKRRVLVYGYGSRAKTFAMLRRRSDRRGYHIVGFVAPPGETLHVNGDAVLTAPAGLRALCAQWDVEEVVVALDDRRAKLPVRELLQCRMAGINVVDLVSFMERETGRILLDALNPSWMIFGDGFRRDALRRFTSRTLDFTASLVLVILTAPVMAITALVIWLDDGREGGGVLYRQERVGYEGRSFELMKFRSMRVNAEAAGAPQWAQTNDPRVTRIGSFLRKSRIDELPQLLNVLRGEMSFVGPRPERPHFVDQLEEKIPYYAQRHSVKPGITGWAQLCFPYGASEDDALQKLQYDLYYVKNNTLLFDLAILVQTAEVIFMGKGR
jgi:sugar transferase (PEP-CTERM system associated)